MRIGIKTKQVIAVTAIVFGAVALMGVFYLLSVSDLLVKETQVRADLLATGVFNRAAGLALEGGDLETAIAGDAALQSILQMANMSRHTSYAAISNTQGVAIAHSNPAMAGQPLASYPTLDTLVGAGPVEKLRAIFTRGGLTREVRLPLALGSTDFGTIHVAVSTLLMRDDVEAALREAGVTAAMVLVGAVLVATLLAQWTLRPIQLIRAGLARLGQGETGVTLALPPEDEFGDLGESFNVVSARLTREQTEGRLSRATVSKRLAALGRVSSGIAHEVKNPLNAMRIHLELLKMQIDEAGISPEHVDTLTQQMKRLDDVVQGFLTFTRPDALSLAPVQVRQLVAGMLPVINAEAGKTGVKVAVDCDDDLPPLLGDRAQLNQALLNIAINACQAMPRGGDLRISAGRSGERHVELRFEDTGAGIAPEHLDKIFNLYFSTKAGGSGVGLALVYRTIHLHDGDIEVESVQDQGTTFRVTLPIAEPKKAS